MTSQHRLVLYEWRDTRFGLGARQFLVPVRGSSGETKREERGGKGRNEMEERDRKKKARTKRKKKGKEKKKEKEKEKKERKRKGGQSFDTFSSVNIGAFFTCTE